MAKPDQNDAIKSRIGLAVAASVQTVPVGLSEGSRYRISPAQRGEGGLAVEALGIAPGSDQEGRRCVRPGAKDADQSLRHTAGEPLKLGLQVARTIAK